MHDLTNGSEPLTPLGVDIHRPAHYTQGNIECIDYITDKGMSYVEGNIIKYITRYRHKGGLKDLYKAQWYITRLINDYTVKLGLEEPRITASEIIRQREDEPEWVPPTAAEIEQYLKSLRVLHCPECLTPASLCEHEEDFSGVWRRESPGATGEGTRLDTYTRSDDDWSLENCRKPVPIHRDNPVCDDPCGEFHDRGCISCVTDPANQVTPYTSPSDAMAHPPGHPYTKDTLTNPCGKGRCIHGAR